MCDPKPLRNRLSRSIAVMALAVGFIVVAAAVNRSAYAPTLPPLLLLFAGACALAATAMLRGALADLDVFCQCIGAECADKGPHVRWAIKGTQVTLVVEAIACFAAGSHAWAPALALPALWIILGAVLVQFGLFNSVLGFVAGLIDCHFKHKEPA